MFKLRIPLCPSEHASDLKVFKRARSYEVINMNSYDHYMLGTSFGLWVVIVIVRRVGCYGAFRLVVRS